MNDNRDLHLLYLHIQILHTETESQFLIPGTTAGVRFWDAGIKDRQVEETNLLVHTR